MSDAVLPLAMAGLTLAGILAGYRVGMVLAGAAALAGIVVGAGKVLMAERKATIALADRSSIAVHGRAARDDRHGAA